MAGKAAGGAPATHVSAASAPASTAAPADTSLTVNGYTVPLTRSDQTMVREIRRTGQPLPRNPLAEREPWWTSAWQHLSQPIGEFVNHAEARLANLAEHPSFANAFNLVSPISDYGAMGAVDKAARQAYAAAPNKAVEVQAEGERVMKDLGIPVNADITLPAFSPLAKRGDAITMAEAMKAPLPAQSRTLTIHPAALGAEALGMALNPTNYVPIGRVLEPLRSVVAREIGAHLPALADWFAHSSQAVHRFAGLGGPATQPFVDRLRQMEGTIGARTESTMADLVGNLGNFTPEERKRLSAALEAPQPGYWDVKTLVTETPFAQTPAGKETAALLDQLQKRTASDAQDYAKYLYQDWKAKPTLFQRVQEVTGGKGLKPSAGDITGEWRMVHPNLRRPNIGWPSDVVAHHLGMDENEMLQQLADEYANRRGVKSWKDFLPQAEQDLIGADPEFASIRDTVRALVEELETAAPERVPIELKNWVNTTAFPNDPRLQAAFDWLDARRNEQFVRGKGLGVIRQSSVEHYFPHVATPEFYDWTGKRATSGTTGGRNPLRAYLSHARQRGVEGTAADINAAFRADPEHPFDLFEVDPLRALPQREFKQIVAEERAKLLQDWFDGKDLAPQRGILGMRKVVGKPSDLTLKPGEAAYIPREYLTYGATSVNPARLADLQQRLGSELIDLAAEGQAPDGELIHPEDLKKVAAFTRNVPMYVGPDRLVSLIQQYPDALKVDPVLKAWLAPLRLGQMAVTGTLYNPIYHGLHNLLPNMFLRAPGSILELPEAMQEVIRQGPIWRRLVSHAGTMPNLPRGDLAFVQELAREAQARADYGPAQKVLRFMAGDDPRALARVESVLSTPFRASSVATHWSDRVARTALFKYLTEREGMADPAAAREVERVMGILPQHLSKLGQGLNRYVLPFLGWRAANWVYQFERLLNEPLRASMVRHAVDAIQQVALGRPMSTNFPGYGQKIDTGRQDAKGREVFVNPALSTRDVEEGAANPLLFLAQRSNPAISLPVALGTGYVANLMSREAGQPESLIGQPLFGPAGGPKVDPRLAEAVGGLLPVYQAEQAASPTSTDFDRLLQLLGAYVAHANVQGQLGAMGAEESRRLAEEVRLLRKAGMLPPARHIPRG